MRISKDTYKLKNDKYHRHESDGIETSFLFQGFGQPGFINIGWNYGSCPYVTFQAYRMKNDPAFIFGSQQPPTFSQNYGRGKCGDKTILYWTINDTDLFNQYYITIQPYGTIYPDLPGVYYSITLTNHTQGVLIWELARSHGGPNLINNLNPAETLTLEINH